ncbi:UNVERIFIED_ORG: hypothetical protein J2806_001091 [Kosakonia oryzae]|uniref:Uncharacterized protein n=1 Tax=Kosakonia radicincitans TaxID=283686 RepID=A0AAX2EU85_9ENTR|nr:hypothetical protein [Kosakonia oryzae]SET26495.1 hypothetical protein SAMN03159294_3064 [Kosakonia radicincitans]SFE34932.1 hypothetical protein SAMN03159468_01720 [Kosakonia radicincitans]SFR17764.1 hypothetical protein SAMN03159514_02979 [Kosakonia radicincitans]SFT75965.1 hypothetical protein SAMN03159428_01965 [Kosakonia radicincitans]
MMSGDLKGFDLFMETYKNFPATKRGNLEGLTIALHRDMGQADQCLSPWGIRQNL